MLYALAARLMTDDLNFEAALKRLVRLCSLAERTGDEGADGGVKGAETRKGGGGESSEPSRSKTITWERI